MTFAMQLYILNLVDRMTPHNDTNNFQLVITSPYKISSVAETL